jgi:uncharacterized repeat protein (TIGR02543 family)
MKFSISLLSICLLSFILIYSCSTEEEESVAPVVQTPQPEPEPEPVEYTLTVSAADGGTVSTEGGTYEEGTEVTITASANEGYRFTGWEGNNSTNESLTITLNSNQTYQAIFELIPIYTLTVNTSDGGTVSTEGGEYQEGAEITITASANEGYRFTGWEGNNSTNESLTITLNSNQTYQAIFELIPTNPETLFQFEYNLHTSLNDFAFKDSIPSIFLRLGEMMPMEPYFDENRDLQINGVSVYSWLAAGPKPFLSIIGDTDQCICGAVNNKLVMSLQLTEGLLNEVANSKYALLAHEFFHVYQMYLSKGFDQRVFWLIEGQAATVESLYLKEFINDSGYIMKFLIEEDSASFDEAIQNVESYESYNGFNSVYGQYGDITIFMNLSLAKILQEQGNSEKESFKIIFEDYWKTDPNDSNWKIKFEEVFGISTSEFYQRLNEFKTNPENLVPEISLSEIFEKE